MLAAFGRPRIDPFGVSTTKNPLAVPKMVLLPPPWLAGSVCVINVPEGSSTTELKSCVRPPKAGSEPGVMAPYGQYEVVCPAVAPIAIDPISTPPDVVRNCM